MKKAICVLILLGIIGLVLKDSFYHFDKDLVALKRQHQSAQRNWSVFYHQRYTYLDSPFRYKSDIKEIRRRIEPNTLILSDKATSYYLSAQLPVFVANIHRHHGIEYQWRQILGKQNFCYLESSPILTKVRSFIARQKDKLPKFSYIVLNRDHQNLNTRFDCLSARGSVVKNVEQIASLVYAGEYLRLYKLSASPKKHSKGTQNNI